MPRIVGHHPANRWENEVLKAFKQQLPADWVVLPSVCWTLQKNGYVKDGEADFVVLAPGLGLVVVEVKGSKEFKVDDAGIWLRSQPDGSWVSLKRSPPEQATSNMHDLVGVLNERHHWPQFPGRYAYLVVYPQGEAKMLPAMFDESTIATRRHMNQLDHRIRNALEKRGGSGLGDQFTPAVLECVIDHLKNRAFRVNKADTGAEVAEDGTKIEQLTRQQFATLRGLFDLPKIAVVGPAGSGKTVLAMWRLRALVEEGRRAAYVCYNRALADSLRLRNPDHAKYIWNVDRLFRELCPGAKSHGDETRFFREELPGLVMDHASLERFDAIIVDEGQDLSEYQVMALNDLVSVDGTWAFFADWRQDLYRAGSGIAIGAEVIFNLHHNCRNTRRINDASNAYLGQLIPSMPGMPEGASPTVELTKNQCQRVWELAKQWSGDGAVAILSPYKLEGSSMAGQKMGHGLHLSEDIKDLGAKGMVYFSTIRSFKGIEADTVIVVDLDKPGANKAFEEEDLYVACTRATTRLAMLTSKKEVARHYLDL